MRLSPKRLVWLLALGATAAYAGAALRPRPIAVDTARAARGPLRVTIDEDGETRIHDRYVVGAPVAGRLERITLHAGDAVERGEVVARLEALPLDRRSRLQAEARLAAAEAERREAEAVVRRQRAAVEQARRTLARLERLAAEQVVAADAVEAARTAVGTAASDLEAARHHARAAAFEATNARAALLDAEGVEGAGTVPILAPVAGRVLRLCEECDKVVAAGTPLLELGDPADLEVVVDVLSSDAVAIRPGAPMLLAAGGEGAGRWQARVRTVEPSGFTKVSPLGVEEQRVNVIGTLLEPPGALGDRFRVEARIVLWEGAGVLKVPAGALFREGDGWAVFVVEEGRARRRTVRLGHRNPDEAEVAEGLRLGETVVVHPSDAVRDGARVRRG
ncbi:MAG TPA: efflux RND transporter periplasmic adaptor subunit [Thermoanaerobaculia bacterium]